MFFWRDGRLAALPWLAHGVTERGGGASGAPYASLNLGLHVGDDAGVVEENRRRVAEAAGFALDRMVCAEQVHGGEVAVVRAAEAGRGARAFADALPGVDALVTETSGLLLTLFFADCVPVLLADPKTRAVAVAHAGWRGLTAGVLTSTLQTLRQVFGAEPADLLAAIGPCIGACCYEVGPEVAAHFSEDLLCPSPRSDRFHLDLAGAAARQLTQAGIPDDRIRRSGHCTSCLPERYFSHRRDGGRTGRIAAVIGVRP